MTRILSPEETLELLQQPTTNDPSQLYPRPIQIGPLRVFEKSDRCASRGCSSPTHYKIQGVWYCTTHALYALNYLVLQSHSDFESVAFSMQSCECKTGKYSMGQSHSADCPIYAQIKEKENA